MALNLNAKEIQQDPYDLYKKLRQEDSLTQLDASHFLFTNKTGFMITRYEDVVAILKDQRFSVDRRNVGDRRDYSKAWWVPSTIRAFMNSMVMVDNPDHARLRNLVHKAFTPQMIQQMSIRVEEISHSLLDQASHKASIDLIADYAFPLPMTIISDIMGVPHEDRPKFRKMITNFMEQQTSSSILVQGQLATNGFALHRFFKKLINLRLKDPQDDLITALVHAEEQGDMLSEAELIAMLLLLLLAGHETTMNLIGNGTAALLEHRDQLEKLKANPNYMESAIEEMLRFTNPVQHIAERYALEDVELNGQIIPKDSALMVNIASANRDEIAFENADQFDITRNPNRHVAFGMGIHYCLGAPLARLEARIAFTALLDRFPDLQLAVPTDALEWRGGTALPLHGLKRLPIILTPNFAR